MSCCYSVSMCLRAVDEEGFVRASHEFYEEKITTEDKPLLYSRSDVEGIAKFVVHDDWMGDLHCAHDTIRIKRHKTGRIHLYTAFNASYGWEGETMNWFETTAPFLADNSWMIIYGEGNGVVRMRVKDGMCSVK